MEYNRERALRPYESSSAEAAAFARIGPAARAVARDVQRGIADLPFEQEGAMVVRSVAGTQIIVRPNTSESTMRKIDKKVIAESMQ